MHVSDVARFAADGEATMSRLSEFDDLLDRVRRSSSFVRALSRFFETLANRYRASKLDGALARVQSWLVASWLYRWLTTEPDPNVVVIDLRESAVLGPILGVVVPRWSGVTAAVTDSVSVGSAKRAAAAFAAAPVRVVSFAVLAAVAGHTVVVGLAGTLSTVALLGRVGLVAVALAGTRVRTNAATLANARVVRLAMALLAPPASNDPDATTDTVDESTEE